MIVAWFLLLLVTQSGVAPATPAARAQALPENVHVSLSIRDGKTVFRSGEPIRLIASFTADRPGYAVDTTIDKHANLEEQFQITPEDGLFRWKELHSMPDGFGRDYGSSANLSTKPVDMVMPLNYWFRFDKPGDYTVRVRTRRVRLSPTSEENLDVTLPWLTTNEITFKVVTMSEQEEEVEARRLSALLDMLSPYDLKGQTERCEDLAFLTGDAGTREKVRRLLHPRGEHIGNWLGDLGMGLYISRNTPLVVELLETQMRDLTQVAGAAPAEFRLWMEMPSLVAEAQGDMNALRARKRARLDALRAEYVKEIIASLPLRVGSARRGTAESILSLLRNNDGSTPAATPPPLPAVVRTILVDEFADFDPMTQGYLVQQHWKDIRDPKLLPALELMVSNPEPWVRGQPMAAILDLAPGRAKPLFISEMLAPRPVDSAAFLELRDETLPAMDRPLLEQVTRLAGSSNQQDKYPLRVKAKYLARYATAAILTDVQQLYEARRSTMELEARVELIAYMDRWDEPGSAERLSRAIAAEKDAGTLLYRLAAARYSKALDAVLRTRLDSDDPRTVEASASLLSRHGPADARVAIEARLNRWLGEWSGKTITVEPYPKPINPQARLQVDLIRAILTGKAWKVSEADAARLKQSCLTEFCQKAFAAR